MSLRDRPAFDKKEIITASHRQNGLFFSAFGETRTGYADFRRTRQDEQGITETAVIFAANHKMPSLILKIS